MSTWLSSDQHFNLPGRANDFRNREAWLKTCTDIYCANERMVTLGDLFAWLQVQALRPSLQHLSWTKTMDAIWCANGEELEALWAILDVAVVGNHDWALCGRSWRGVEFVPKAVAAGVYFTHGSEHDWWIANDPMRAERIARWVAWAEWFIHRDADLWAANAWRWLTGTGRHGENDSYWRPIAEDADRAGCDSAFFAHTHQWGTRTVAWKTGGRRMIRPVIQQEKILQYGADPQPDTPVFGKIESVSPVVVHRVRVFNTGSWTEDNTDVTCIFKGRARCD